MPDFSCFLGVLSFLSDLLSVPTQGRVALITGVTGQNASSLGERRLEKGYAVHGNCFAEA